MYLVLTEHKSYAFVLDSVKFRHRIQSDSKTDEPTVGPSHEIS